MPPKVPNTSADDAPVKYKTKKLNLEELSDERRAYIKKFEASFKACNYNIVKMSRREKLSRPAIYRRLHMFGIRIPESARRHRSVFDRPIVGVTK